MRLLLFFPYLFFFCANFIDCLWMTQPVFLSVCVCVCVCVLHALGYEGTQEEIPRGRGRSSKLPPPPTTTTTASRAICRSCT
ncbi:hypothetical protein TCDM_04632 [Trypanosoma cruzi Dm28c]|uniref:Uncharacterized protein n=1 Tax=Trypanosoma cruzi Dm28c TaxID=1416333 RepID=V5BG09_TRYCR|nr:hypothetical protein TCDM_04632 [Trypanosoma cruzi Dm28c]